MSKTLTDLEQEYLKQIEGKTIQEVIQEYRASGFATPFDSQNSYTELVDSFIFMQDEFFRFLFHNQDFLTIPILAITKSGSEYNFIMEDTGDAYFKSITFSEESGINLVLTTMHQHSKTNWNYKTMKDFLQNPPEDIDISLYGLD